MSGAMAYVWSNQRYQQQSDMSGVMTYVCTNDICLEQLDMSGARHMPVAMTYVRSN